MPPVWCIEDRLVPALDFPDAPTPVASALRSASMVSESFVRKS
ncbi:hypothetical protein [Labilithrix luteola]|nr:hypothetical protein [Labilithrix luteola]